MPRSIHGGNVGALAAASGLAPELVIDASANLNPLGPPEWLDGIWEEVKRDAGRYPDPSYTELREAASKKLGVDPRSLVFGNGADELFYALASVLASRSRRGLPPVAPLPGARFPEVPSTEAKAVIVEPSYASYREALESAGFVAGSLFLREENNFQYEPEVLVNLVSSMASGSSLWLGRPVNPVGLAPTIEEIATIADGNPGVAIVVDEAFLEFLDNEESRRSGGLAPSAALLRENVVVIRSMTKFWSVPGIRLGYLVADPGLAVEVRDALPAWPVSCMAVRFGVHAFADPGTHLMRTRHLVDFERRRIRTALSSIPGLTVFPGDANFFLCRILSGTDAPTLVAALASRGIGVRDCSSYAGLDRFFIRIGLRKPEDNDRIVKSLADALEFLPAIHESRSPVVPGISSAGRTEPAGSGIPGAPSGDGSALSKDGSREFRGGDRPSSPEFLLKDPSGKPGAGSGGGTGSGSGLVAPRARALMIQGCSSSAGKSLVAAAFCRILRDMGFDVAPYKAQNMSLNSAVTPDGLEIGRAQALQAAACGLEPDVRMNPVLLKPSTDSSSQVVIMGRPDGHMAARDYYTRSRLMRETAYRAYDSLASEHEVIVLEGAGSPGEINLKRRDFVNMRAAFHSGARVLLVGDIDRGGVFASFIGHMATFSPAERDVISGFIVNKFRGDPLLLGDAFEMTRRATGKPVLGCIPYIRDLSLPDEDEPRLLRGEKASAPLRIAVAKLSRVSNFTDLDPLDAEPDVSVVPVSSGDELSAGVWDAVIIPGTKSTIADMELLRSRGFDRALLVCAAKGVQIVGICGGLQMLGSVIVDPERVESPAGRAEGFALMPLMTSFARDKTLRRAVARHEDSGFEIEGYEIHHGETWIEDGISDGASGGFSREMAGGTTSGIAAVSGESFGAGAVGGPDSLAKGPADGSAKGSAKGSGTPAGTRCRISMRLEDGTPVGWSSGTVTGCYVHGLFDRDEYRGWFLDRLRSRRGLPLSGARPFRPLDAEIDRLASVVRNSCDIGAILKDTGLRL